MSQVRDDTARDFVFLTFPEGTQVQGSDGSLVSLPDIPFPVPVDRAEANLDLGEVPVNELVEGMVLAIGHAPEGRWVSEYRRLVFEFDPTVDTRLIEEGASLANRGRLHEALTCFQCLVALVPTFVEGMYNLGMVLSELGRQDAVDGERYLLRSVEVLERVIEACPDYGQAYYHLGFACRDLGRLDEARDAWTVFHRLAGEGEQRQQVEVLLDDLKQIRQIEAAFEEGRRRLMEGEVDAAAALLDAAVEGNPEWVDARLLAGVAQRRRGHLAEAVDHLERAAALAPERVEIRNELGLCYLEDERFDEAIRCFHLALDLAPDAPATLCNLGLAHSSLGNAREAASLVRRALELAPDDEATLACAAELGVALPAAGE